MRNSADNSKSYERRIEEATERMARRMGVSFQRNERWTEVVRSSSMEQRDQA